MNVRPRKHNKNLPQCVYFKHGSYWYVKKGKWHKLGKDLAEALREYSRHIKGPEAGIDALVDKAWPLITAKLKPNTIKQYEHARTKVKQAFQEFRPDQVRPRDVAAFLDHYSATPNMANRYLSFLRNVMHYAVRWQIVESNPCAGIKRLDEARRGRYLTDGEFAAILKAASPSLKPIILIAYYTGQRISDILSLKLADIDKAGIRFQPIKTKGSTGARILVEMTPELESAISMAKALPRPVRGLTLFCTARWGRPYAYRTVRDMWVAAVKRAKVEDANLHDIRAKALTDAKNQGLDAQALGGHTTEDRTNRYIRARDTISAKPPSFRQRLDKKTN